MTPIITLLLLSITLLFLLLQQQQINGIDYQLHQIGTKITPPISTGSFGEALSMTNDGKKCVVGSPTANDAGGTAYVYVYNGLKWNIETQIPTPNDMIGVAHFGYAVSISGDGQYLVVSANEDNNGRGATWSYFFNGTTWIQEPSKIVSNNCSNPNCFEGNSIAMNYYGSMLAVGAPYDDNFDGSVFVYSHTALSSWTQFGSKLTSTDLTDGGAELGWSIAISHNGLTIIAGAPADSANVGAAVIFEFDPNLQHFVQQGAKLTPFGFEGSYTNFGQSVSISGDGNLVAIGAPADNNNFGCIYLFQRVLNTWWQKGWKIIPSNALGASEFGHSVQLNSQGNRAIVGAYADNIGIGAAYFLILDDVEGTKQYRMTGNDYQDANFEIFQGISVAMDGAGDNFLVGGYADNGGDGGVWHFTASQDDTTLSLVKLQNTVDEITLKLENSANETATTLIKLQDDIEVIKRMIQLISPPSRSPSKKPTTKPSKSPSRAPSKAPKTTKPSKNPSHAPSKAPKFSKPSKSPSLAPTKKVG
jgi:hypothetical protein